MLDKFRRNQTDPHTEARIDVVRHRVTQTLREQGPVALSAITSVIGWLIALVVGFSERLAALVADGLLKARTLLARYGPPAAAAVARWSQPVLITVWRWLRPVLATVWRYAEPAVSALDRRTAGTRAQLASRARTLLASTTASHRGRTALAGVAAVLAIGAGGLVANLASSMTEPTGAVVTTDVLADRSDAVDRADRASREGSSDAAKAQPAAEKPDWVHPMPGAATTSCFGQRWGVLHAGVDLASPPGTPIQAVGDGTVTHAGWVFPGYGISVMIDHHNGYYTHYAHASEAKVSPGDRVSAGDVIALEGSTGNSTGPHLHFEVHKDGLWNQVEPVQWLANRDVHIPGC